MSWGERSCKKPCRNKKCSPEICNVDCEHYEWDGKTEPDSIGKVIHPWEYRLSLKQALEDPREW